MITKFSGHPSPTSSFRILLKRVLSVIGLVTLMGNGQIVVAANAKEVITIISELASKLSINPKTIADYITGGDTVRLKTFYGNCIALDDPDYHLVINSCSSTWKQTVDFEKGSTQYLPIVQLHIAGDCFNIKGGVYKPGVEVIKYPCANNLEAWNELFIPISNKEPEGTIYVVLPPDLNSLRKTFPLCLTASSREIGSKLTVETCTLKRTQIFTLDYNL